MWPEAEGEEGAIGPPGPAGPQGATGGTGPAGSGGGGAVTPGMVWPDQLEEPDSFAIPVYPAPKNIYSPYNPGTFTVPTENFVTQIKKLVLTGADRGALVGTARLYIQTRD